MYSKMLLSLEDARIAGEAALAKAMENPDRPMAIAIGDATGELVYFLKMNNALPLFPKMAMNKMYTSIHFGMDTADIEKFLKIGGLTVKEFGDSRLVTIAGGVCLRAPDGTVLGAIGTSGRASTVDKVTDLDVALAGAKALSV